MVDRFYGNEGKNRKSHLSDCTECIVWFCRGRTFSPGEEKETDMVQGHEKEGDELQGEGGEAKRMFSFCLFHKRNKGWLLEKAKRERAPVDAEAEEERSRT